MLTDLIRRYIAAPVAKVASRLPFEPVAIAGAIAVGASFFKDQLDGGADMETALTASLLALGTWLVRSKVWSNARVEQDFGGEQPLEAPVTGVDD